MNEFKLRRALFNVSGMLEMVKAARSIEDGNNIWEIFKSPLEETAKYIQEYLDENQPP
jgi:hypothetical protein